MSETRHLASGKKVYWADSVSFFEQPGTEASALVHRANWLRLLYPDVQSFLADTVGRAQLYWGSEVVRVVNPLKVESVKRNLKRNRGSTSINQRIELIHGDIAMMITELDILE